MKAASATLTELRYARDQARAEYLAAARMVPHNTPERGKKWRAFRDANAAYLRARGDAR